MQQINELYTDYLITTDKSLMSITDIHHWLAEKSYWCANVPFEIVKTSFDNSFCIGAIRDGRQIAFARLITDYATFGYLADVYVTEEHRGKGISKKMMELILDLDWVKNLRGIKLQTKDGHGLYAQYGFTVCKYPERIMEISRPGMYDAITTTTK
jgi:GNAT superfamily N-acetyltransferase